MVEINFRFLDRLGGTVLKKTLETQVISMERFRRKIEPRDDPYSTRNSAQSGL